MVKMGGGAAREADVAGAERGMREEEEEMDLEEEATDSAEMQTCFCLFRKFAREVRRASSLFSRARQPLPGDQIVPLSSLSGFFSR